MRRYVVIWLLAAATAVGILAPSAAVPVFARKYGFNCTMCHSNFPRLNDYGQRYRMNGYRLPGREDDDKTVLETPAPFAMRTSAGFNSDKFKNTADSTDVSQFQLNGVDLLSGGLIGDNVGYFMIYTPQINGSRGVAAQDGSLEMANVVFALPGMRFSTVRIGRFEPAYVAVSAKRSLTFSPYEIYDVAYPAGLPFSDTQTGVEFAGACKSGIRYAAGWVNGTSNNADDDMPTDFYVRVAKVFGEGEGQTAGHRVGMVSYIGKARPEGGGGSRCTVKRFGADGSFNWQGVNLSCQYMRGRDAEGIWDTGLAYKFSGGFVEASWLPTHMAVGFARYDWVSRPATDDGGDVRRWTVGGRYYFEDNLALHVEYSDRREDKLVGPAAVEKMFTVRLDFAF